MELMASIHTIHKSRLTGIKSIFLLFRTSAVCNLNNSQVAVAQQKKSDNKESVLFVIFLFLWCAFITAAGWWTVEMWPLISSLWCLLNAARVNSIDGVAAIWSPPLGYQRHVSSLQQKSLNLGSPCSITERQACWPARLTGSSDLSGAGCFVVVFCLDWCWRTDTLLHHLWTDVNRTDTKHSKHLFLFLCHSSTGKTLVSWCGKKGWGTWGLLSLLLMFSCSRLLFLFWKHQRWELSRLRVLNICPSLQH